MKIFSYLIMLTSFTPAFSAVWLCGAESDTYSIVYSTDKNTLSILEDAEPREKLIGDYECSKSAGTVSCAKCISDPEFPCDSSFKGEFVEAEKKAKVFKSGTPVAALSCIKRPPPPQNLAWATPTPLLNIQGNWVTPCQDLRSEIDRITVRGNRITIEKKTFNDKKCLTGLYGTLNISGTLRIGPTSQIVPNARNTKLIYSSMTMTLNFGKTVEYMNSIEFCGYSDWKLDQPKNLLGRKCSTKKMPASGDTNFGLISLANSDEFLMGKETEQFDGSTLESRPRELDLENPFFRE